MHLFQMLKLLAIKVIMLGQKTSELKVISSAENIMQILIEKKVNF
jgi:hypothetical protein